MVRRTLREKSNPQADVLVTPPPFIQQADTTGLLKAYRPAGSEQVGEATVADAVALARLMEEVEIFTPDWAAVGENLDRHVDAWKSATGSCTPPRAPRHPAGSPFPHTHPFTEAFVSGGPSRRTLLLTAALATAAAPLAAFPALVKTYTADTPSRAEKLTLQVPPGARTAQIRFRCTAGDNWFWTVDAVSLTAS